MTVTGIAPARLKEVSMYPSSNSDTFDKRTAFLKKVPLFATLPAANLHTLVGDFHSRVYEKDALIFRQGDTSCELFVIVSGKVRVYTVSPAGNETSISLFSIGSIIGEFAAIDCQPRSATAKVQERCTVLEMPGDQFVRRIREMPDLALSLAQLLVQKVRWTTEYAETIAQFDAAGRLLHILLVYNEQFGEVVEPGKRYELDLAINQSDLASLIGARREWVNRNLQMWHRKGLIEYKSGKIIILDLPQVIHERDSRIEALRDAEQW